MWIQQHIDRNFTLNKSAYEWWGKRYKAEDIYKYIEEKKVKKEKIYIDSMSHPTRFQNLSAIDFAEHMIRVQNASLDYPIVIHFDWYVVDWYHRIIKAIIEKRKFIYAYRIDVTQVKSENV